MACYRNICSLALSQLCLLVLVFSFAHAAPQLYNRHISGGEGDGVVSLRRSVVEGRAPVGQNASFILAADRTRRKDPLDSFKVYDGGWNISDRHYWASVGFTAAPLFSIALIWLLGFGLVLCFICCCYCCCPPRNYSYSRTCLAISLVLLTLFTGAAIIGCIVLYNGQGKFHGSTSTTLDFVVGQSNLTVINLRNFSSYLAAAKNVGVNGISLPADGKQKIDVVMTEINTSADDLASRTSSNSAKIRDALDAVRFVLIVVAAIMLLLAFLGLFFSVLGVQFLVHILVLSGWILIAGTFILCGAFLLLHKQTRPPISSQYVQLVSVVADTCVAMDEWVLHPQQHTALDDILPCVDAATTNESLNQSKEVTYQLANVVNVLIMNITNVNYPPFLRPLYYNQSGPLVPVLCNPYHADMSARTCAAGEVSISNASQVWMGYLCSVSVVSGSEVCRTVGRITPKFYSQMTAAVNVSYGLYHYGPFLAQLADCTFVRQTFRSISQDDCPDLGRNSENIYIGLVVVSIAVMLSLIFWLIYARETRHRKYIKQFEVRSDRTPVPEKSLLNNWR